MKKIDTKTLIGYSYLFGLSFLFSLAGWIIYCIYVLSDLRLQKCVNNQCVEIASSPVDIVLYFSNLFVCSYVVIFLLVVYLIIRLIKEKINYNSEIKQIIRNFEYQDKINRDKIDEMQNIINKLNQDADKNKQLCDEYKRKYEEVKQGLESQNSSVVVVDVKLLKNLKKSLKNKNPGYMKKLVKKLTENIQIQEGEEDD